MTKAPKIKLQDLRRRIYVKAKAEPSWRFWGMYVHACKLETLREAYLRAKRNNGAPGIDGVTFEVIDKGGVEHFLEQLRDELTSRTYRPMRTRRQEIPKGGGKVRVLSIPCIRDRVVQGAVKLILEPIFEADFQPGSFGYRPKRTAHQALKRVEGAIARYKIRVIDIDLRAFFDNVRHHLLFEKIARRINDDAVMGLLKMILKSTGKRGLPQGGPLSPLLSNVYLNEVDRMLERAKATTRNGRHTFVEYARFADDLVVLVDGFPRHDWLQKALTRRLHEEFAALQVEVNEEKSRVVNLEKDESFGFLGFDFRRVRGLSGVWRPMLTPKLKTRVSLTRRIKRIFRRFRSQPVRRVIVLINPILRGWVNYFSVGSASRCFGFVQDWVEKKVRRHLERARKRQGFGWKRWSKQLLYDVLGLFNGYKVQTYKRRPKALPAR